MVVGRTDLRIRQSVLPTYLIVLLQQRKYVLHVEGHESLLVPRCQLLRMGFKVDVAEADGVGTRIQLCVLPVVPSM